MIFTPQDIQEIFSVVDYRVAIVVADVLGKDFLTKEDEEVLKANGFDLEKEIQRIPLFWQAYLFGRLSSLLTPRQLLTLGYTDVKKYIERNQYKEPTRREIAEYKAAATNTYLYIKGMGNKVKETLSNSISKEELLISVKEREEEVRRGIKEGIERGVLERRSIQNIVSDLGHKLDEWNRDWGRIVETEMQNVYLVGKAQAIMDDHGIDAKVYKQVFNGACFPVKDTEFLTNEGFKFIDDIRGDELVATYNLETNTLEYSPIISKIKYLYKGDMHSYSHQSLDLICTPNHKMLVSLDYKKDKIVQTRNSLIDSSDTLNKKLYYMRYSVENWNGFDCDTIEVVGHSFSTECFARFMGWYLSEGHCVFRGKDDKGRFHASSICISQRKKENLQEIFNCMRDLFGKNVTYQNSSVFVVSLDKSWDSFVLWLKSLGTKAWLKIIPQEIKTLSKRFLLEFIDTYLKGDNYYTYLGKETLGKKHTGIITSSPKLRDDFMEVILKCGLRSSTQTLDNIGRITYDKRGVKFKTHRLTYVVRILTSTKFTSIYKHRKILRDWEGEVGCIEVEKNNTIFIRRNGTCIWTGNCKHCIKFYTQRGIGTEPRVFKLKDLIANSTNIGLKQRDWKPTLGPVHPFCYDDETEVFTNQGWKLFKDLKGDELFWSLNVDGEGKCNIDVQGTGVWVKAVDVFSVWYEGEMFEWKDKDFSLKVTPNHNHVTTRDFSATVQIKRLQDIDWHKEGFLSNAEKGYIAIFPIDQLGFYRSHYKGFVYDVTLETNHILLVRRNGGRSVVSGNCRCELRYIPEGYVWDEELKAYAPPKDYKPKVKRRSKVTITVGDKKFKV